MTLPAPPHAATGGLGLPVVSAAAYVAIDTTENDSDAIAPAFVAIILLIAGVYALTNTVSLTLTRPMFAPDPPASQFDAPSPTANSAAPYMVLVGRRILRARERR